MAGVVRRVKSEDGSEYEWNDKDEVLFMIVSSSEKETSGNDVRKYCSGLKLATIYSHQGETLLHKAAEKGRLDICVVLLEMGMPVDVRNAYSQATPLHDACSTGQVKVADMLIGRGANVNAKDIWGKTPVHQCCYFGHLEVLKLLMSKNADLNVANGEGSRPILLAKMNKHKDIQNLLKTVVGKGGDDEEATAILDEIYEYSRYQLFKNAFTSTMLPTDPARFCNKKGKACTREDMEKLKPEGWEYVTEWTIQKRQTTDGDGWEYSTDFRIPTGWKPVGGSFDHCRRRVWQRTRKNVAAMNNASTNASTNDLSQVFKNTGTQRSLDMDSLLMNDFNGGGASAATNGGGGAGESDGGSYAGIAVQAAVRLAAGAHKDNNNSNNNNSPPALQPHITEQNVLQQPQQQSSTILQPQPSFSQPSPQQQIDEIYELARYSLMKKEYSSKSLLMTDPPSWCDKDLKATDKNQIPIGSGWEVLSDWNVVTKEGVTDKEGWQYGSDFRMNLGWKKEGGMADFCARRTWRRVRVKK